MADLAICLHIPNGFAGFRCLFNITLTQLLRIRFGFSFHPVPTQVSESSPGGRYNPSHLPLLGQRPGHFCPFTAVFLVVTVTYRLALTGQNRRWELSDLFPVVRVFTVARFSVVVKFENL